MSSSNPLQTSPSYWMLAGAVFFMLVAWVLNRQTVEGLGLGFSAEVFAVGLAVLLPYSIERMLQRPSFRVWVRPALDIVLIVAALFTLALFSTVRGINFKNDISGGSAVVIEGATPSPAPSDDGDRTGELLRWAWMCSGLALEVACGVCWGDYSESRKKSNIGALHKLEKEILDVEEQRLAGLTELEELLAEPARTYSTRWAEFRRGISEAMVVMDQVAQRGGRFAAALLFGLVAVNAATAAAAESVHIVVLLDLSATQQVKAFGERTEFEENVSAVSHVLERLPAGAGVDIVGITAESQTNPAVLLSARLPLDAGYRGYRLAKGRRELLLEWQRRSSKLRADSAHTDLIGALSFASELLAKHQAKRKLLMLLSDMRAEVPGVIDLERPNRIAVDRSILTLEKRQLIFDLRDTEVFVYGAGAHGVDKPPEYGATLKAWWVEYIRRANARLRVFSTTRSIYDLQQMLGTN